MKSTTESVWKPAKILRSYFKKIMQINNSAVRDKTMFTSGIVLSSFIVNPTCSGQTRNGTFHL